MAGDTHDGRSTQPPATTSKVPTRDELRARWTCDCELLGLVRPRVAGSHTAAAVLCGNRRKVGSTEGGARVGDVAEILARSDWVVGWELPATIDRLWRILGRTGHITWAMCSKMRQRPNPEYQQTDEDLAKDKSVGKTILVPEAWESWALRSSMLRGTWGGWSGEKVTPENFWVRAATREVLWQPINYTLALELARMHATGDAK